MTQAIIASMRSKDPSRKVGCVIVDKNNRILSTGYNGFPAGTNNSDFTWNKYSDKYSETKYAYVVHAEANAILHTNQSYLKGSSLYVTLFPCNECAKMIVSKKIKKVYYLEDSNISKEECISSMKIFKSADIKLKKIKIKKKTKKIINELF